MRFEHANPASITTRSKTLSKLRRELVDEFRRTSTARLRELRDDWPANGAVPGGGYPARLVGELRRLHWEARLMGFSAAATVIGALANVVSLSTGDCGHTGTCVPEAINEAIEALAPSDFDDGPSAQR